MRTKRFWGFLATIIILLTQSCGGGGGGPDEPIIPPEPPSLTYTLRSTNSMEKITPISDIKTFGWTIKIEGARGEHEAFQILPILSDPKETMHDVRVVAEPLIGPDYQIPKENITIYTEHYLKVIEPSDKGGRVGYWPDALTPFTTPFEVSGSFPVPVWIDVEIPYDAPAGIYNGQIIFMSSDAGNQIFHYTLEVWDITLPKKKYMKANFGLDQEDIKWAHDFHDDIASPEGREISRLYADFLAERYISTNCLPIFQPYAMLKPDRRSFWFDFTEMDKDIAKYLDDYDLPAIAFPLNRFDLYPSGCIGQGQAIFTSDFNARFLDYTEQVSQRLYDRGYLDRAFAQFMDEPYCFEQYEFIRDIYDVFKLAYIHPDHLVPEQPRPDNENFGSLLNHVDIFVMSVSALKWASEDEIRAGAENKQEWIYTNAAVYPYPSVAIDKQGVESRLFVWYAYQRKFKGIYYGSVCDWSTVNPWVNPLTFGPGMGNGCNSLLYPGTICQQFTGQDNVNGPIGSIRLELTRDGLEDAELLYMLGKGGPVEEVLVLISDWETYTNNPEELLRIRRQIASLIMQGGR